MATESPIGRLVVEATRHAWKKANGHTASADCGCSVTVAFFSADSSRLDFEHCPAHPKGK